MLPKYFVDIFLGIYTTNLNFKIYPSKNVTKGDIVKNILQKMLHIIPPAALRQLRQSTAPTASTVAGS